MRKEGVAVVSEEKGGVPAEAWELRRAGGRLSRRRNSTVADTDSAVMEKQRGKCHEAEETQTARHTEWVQSWLPEKRPQTGWGQWGRECSAGRGDTCQSHTEDKKMLLKNQKDAQCNQGLDNGWV